MIKKAILFIVLVFLSFFSYFSYADALDQAFSSGKNYQIVSSDTNINSGKVSGWVQKTAKLMLKISIMVGLAVFLYGGIRFFLSMGDDSKAKKVRDSLITAGIGLIIAFGAWGILQIIISIGTSLSTGQ